jgi:NAD dependent epimerase/dehydratase family enzyme
MVIHNRRMTPNRILESGYQFQHPEAREALMSLFLQTGHE